MIIQIRGTSGSGKSTVMQQVMKSLGKWNPVMRKGRKQPLGYERPGMIVLGHYESPCGGCDTIGSAKTIFELIQNLDYPIILCEGLLLSEDTKWSSQLNDLRIVYLTTPLSQCLTWVDKRRKEAGNTKPLNPTNTSNRVKVIERSRIKLKELDVTCRRCPPTQALSIILSWINPSFLNS
jgi:hypothetical protein